MSICGERIKFMHSRTGTECTPTIHINRLKNQYKLHAHEIKAERCYSYLAIRFDNDEDEAEFILKYSDGLELDCDYADLPYGSIWKRKLLWCIEAFER